MTIDEVIAIMDKPLSNARTPQYRIIYQMATGKPWKGCFCGNGWNNFARACKNYANALKAQKLKNNDTTIIS